MVTTPTIGETLYWSYASLAMAHAAVSSNATKYGVVHFSIRSKLYKRLCTGSRRIGPIADDERLKLILPQACAYCGGRERLAADHVVPRARGGADEGDNLIWACTSCNSSKGTKDLLAWFEARGEFLPLLLLRRYVKLAVVLCAERDLLGREVGAAEGLPM
jgi:HNH endonuclease